MIGSSVMWEVIFVHTAELKWIAVLERCILRLDLALVFGWETGCVQVLVADDCNFTFGIFMVIHYRNYLLGSLIPLVGAEGQAHPLPVLDLAVFLASEDLMLPSRSSIAFHH